MSKSLLLDALMVVALLLIGAASYLWSPLLSPSVDVTVTPGADCDLQKAGCEVGLPDGGRLRFDLAPKPIPATESLLVSVELAGLDAEKVAIDFAGVSMNMGVNRQGLERMAPGSFAGRTTLPVCVSGRMAWQATVLVESGRKRIAVPFQFDAGH